MNQGDLLFEIDSRPFREALRQAEAAVAKDEAQIRVAEANPARSRAQLKNAKADATGSNSSRKKAFPLGSRKTRSEQLPRWPSMPYGAMKPRIETMRAALDADRAAVEQAKSNLAYCEIRAPISGRAGNLLVHPGNLVKANGDQPAGRPESDGADLCEFRRSGAVSERDLETAFAPKAVRWT